MPELPEVETMRRGVLPIVGATITTARRTPCPRKPIAITPTIGRLQKRVSGREIVAVERLGKRVVVRLDSADRLIFEPRMTGLVLITQPPTEIHLRFALDLENSPVPHLLFWDQRGLGNVSLLSEKKYQQKLTDGKLGPDALSIDSATFRDRFRHSGREVKVALLDQSAVAGLGNLYASEILHLAGVHPQVRCNKLTVKRWERIFNCMVEVLNLAIKYEGSTLSDGTYRNALNKAGGYQNAHRVYDRADQTCPTCQVQSVTRIVQAQRSTFFCKRCQTRR